MRLFFLFGKFLFELIVTKDESNGESAYKRENGCNALYTECKAGIVIYREK